MRQEAVGLFRLLDADADGRLSYNDLVTSLGLLSRDTSPKQLAAAAASSSSASDSAAPQAPPHGPAPPPPPPRDDVRSSLQTGPRLPAPATVTGARPGTAAIFLMRPASRAR